MKAIAAIFEESGIPIRLQEVSIPPLKDGEVLVEVTACALCRSDLSTYSGRRIEPTPTILGHEIVGTVVDSRAGAAIGERVTWSIAASCAECYLCNRELSQKCESLFKYGHTRLTDEAPLSGGLASHILLRPGTAIFPVPANLQNEVAVLSNCSTSTAASVIRAGRPQPGDCVVVFGAGVLGLTSAAMLKEQGCQVIAFDPNPASAERALRFGAEHACVEDQALKHIVLERTNGRGADVCLELSGARTAAEAAVSLLRVGGTAAWAGTASPVGQIDLDPNQTVRRMLTLKGIHNYGPAHLETALAFLVENQTKYPFKDLIGDRFRLADVQSAFETADRFPGRRILVEP